MSNDKVVLDTFPSSKFEALTMLYLQNQDLSSFSPEDLVIKYKETYERIRQQFTVERKNINFNPIS
jgi:hypothetical protein